MLAILIILLTLVFISGAPLFTIMLGGTALGAFFSQRGFTIGFDGAINKMFGTSGRDEIEVLSTIPLFIYAGYLLAEAKTADRLVRFANAMMGWLPGGLAVVTIGTCALFTVFTGASGVTIIALGGVLMPALVRNGYPERFSMGLIAGTGSVGLLFPPALPLFIYGTVYGLTGLDKENWDTRRFLFAGVVPGMLLIGMLSAVAIFVAVKKNLPRQKFEFGELGKSFIVALPELFIPFGVILGLASGFGLPEIAALTVVYVTILEVAFFKTITLKTMWGISFEAMAMIGAIFMIIFASTAFTDFMVNAEVPKKLVAFTQENVESKVVFLLAINVILLIVGTVMDIFSAIVVVLPLIAPIAKAYGIDPYHLGVIFLLNLEVGYLHPPVGLNLFLTSVKFQRPITEVMWATIPFLVTMIAALIIVTYVPSLTVVPEAERMAPVKNLVVMVETALEEGKVAYPTLALTDDRGNEIKGPDGKPVTRVFTDCAKITDENERNVCQALFFEVTACKPKKDSTDPKEVACKNAAIAKWTVANMNGDALHPEYAVTTMTELALVDLEGKPLEWDEPVLDAKGQPVMTEDGDPKTEKKPLVGADGKPIVKKLASCDAKSGTEKDTCRALFVESSNCYIAAPDHADCITEKTKECTADAPAPAPDGGSGSAGSGTAGSGSAGSAAGSDSATGSAAPPAANCVQTKTDECRTTAIKECVRDKIHVWLEDNGSHAKDP